MIVTMCANRPTLRKLRAEDMFETWVSVDDFTQVKKLTLDHRLHTKI